MTYRIIKRAVDVVVAVGVLVVASPLIAATALLVRVGLGSPVLFRQIRPGLNGQPFEIVKFRTMKDGPGNDADRLSKLGKILRASSLDELPELMNVVRGEMSLVGPRPLLPQYLERYSSRQARRHEVRPGVTGLAQVRGRNALSWEERLEMDVQYVEQMSLKLDMQILAETVTSVVKRTGVNAEGHATMPAFTGSETEPGESIAAPESAP